MLYNRALDLRLSVTWAKAQFYKPWPIIGYRATDLSLSLTGKMAFRDLVLYIMLYNRALDLRLSLTCAKAQFYKPWPIIGHGASDLRLSLTCIESFRCSVL